MLKRDLAPWLRAMSADWEVLEDAAGVPTGFSVLELTTAQLCAALDGVYIDRKVRS